MSTFLWKYYLENDVDNFRQLLASANYNSSGYTRPHTAGSAAGTTIGSPGKILSTSPTVLTKSRKSSVGLHGSRGHKPYNAITLTRADINSKDAHGVTLLHWIASSLDESALSFALALLSLPLLDLYIQDLESGWTALHRALYFGNITIARVLMQRDLQDDIGHSNTGGLIKIKDREGNSPFDVFGASITNRALHHNLGGLTISAGLEVEEDEIAHGESGDSDYDGSTSKTLSPRVCIDGDELLMFGSNKNLTLGFGDEDDRQYPERIALKRPEHLLRRLHVEHYTKSRYIRTTARSPKLEEPDIFSSNSLPASVQYQSVVIQDVKLSKLHTAILTTDPEANLYICGFGPGGRLGTGDEATRFKFTCIFGGGLAGKKVISVGLGQNHTIAISNTGEVFTWGSNAFGQLGYSIPNSSSLKDEEPLQLLPRQIFGPLKREVVVGAAASRTHSVVFTSTSLYTFGKNDGQLGLVDSDARSLETQVTPRKVAASLFTSSIGMVSAIDKATVCLLDNHDVWIFANYGYMKMSYPLDSFSNYFLKSSYSTTRYDDTPNHISKICAGGDTICAMSRMGDIFTVTVSQKTEPSPVTASTTNPAKIRGALSSPQRVWSLRKSHMAIRDVDVGQDGSVIICTESGSVWKRVKRAKIKDIIGSIGTTEYKPKDYKFARIPGLTRITAVRSNAFGAYAAIRRDCDVLRTQVQITSNTLWNDLFPLLPFHNLSKQEDSDTEEPTPRLWAPRQAFDNPASVRRAVLTSPDLRETLAAVLRANNNPTESIANEFRLGTTLSDVLIPCHEFIIAGRSTIMRRALAQFRQSYFFEIPEVLTIEYSKEGNILIMFKALDLLTIVNLILFIYTDSVVDVWHHTRHSPQSAPRYRQVRTELMKVAATLELRSLEHAARLMVEPSKTLHQDMELAIMEPGFFDNGDIIVELNKSVMKVHSSMLCRRCPFFEGLFNGRAGGIWLSSRRKLLGEPQEAIKVDLQHIDLDIFRLALRHIYADSGEELFDDVVATDLDDFLDKIMDVMSVANELMVDRLAQICQKVLGRFVTTRNVCQLLNAVAPCSVTEFKDAALEYICLNLESMLENQLLNELDDDVMLELDQIVRQNQLACLPFAKSGRAEAELLERFPELVITMERNKRAKIDSMALQSRLHEDEVKYASTNKIRPADIRASLTTPPYRHESPTTRTQASKSPSLRPRASAHDLMFDMDDETEISFIKGVSVESRPGSSKGRDTKETLPNQPRTPLSSLPREDIWFDSKGKAMSPTLVDAISRPFLNKDQTAQGSLGREKDEIREGNSVGRGQIDEQIPWGSTALLSQKLDMKDIMAQASTNRSSYLASALSERLVPLDMGKPITSNKLSQKERKKQSQQQQILKSHFPSSPEIKPLQSSSNPKTPVSPWQTASNGPKLSLKDILGGDLPDSSPPVVEKLRTSSNPSLTMRQTVAGDTAATRETFTELIPQAQKTSQRSISTPTATKPTQSSPSRDTPIRSSPLLRQSYLVSHAPSTPSIAIKSIRQNPPLIEPSLQLSMADILSQQQTEKDIFKEAAAKRSLQEIQEEQAFNEWWDQESRKAIEEEQKTREAPGESRVARNGRGGRGGRGKGRGMPLRGRRRGRGGGESGTGGGESTGADGQGWRGRGRSRGGGGTE